MKKNLFLFVSTFVILLSGFNSNSQTSKEDYIRAFNIDYNWGPGGAHIVLRLLVYGLMQIPIH